MEILSYEIIFFLLPFLSRPNSQSLLQSHRMLYFLKGLAVVGSAKLCLELKAITCLALTKKPMQRSFGKAK
jgi:hypothetical protein